MANENRKQSPLPFQGKAEGKCGELETPDNVVRGGTSNYETITWSEAKKIGKKKNLLTIGTD